MAPEAENENNSDTASLSAPIATAPAATDQHQQVDIDLALAEVFPRVDRRIIGAGDERSPKQRTHASQAGPISKCVTTVAAMPAAPQTLARVASNFHSGSSVVPSA